MTRHIKGHGFARDNAITVKHAHKKSVGTSPKRTPGNGFLNPGTPAASRAAMLYQSRNTGTGR